MTSKTRGAPRRRSLAGLLCGLLCGAGLALGPGLSRADDDVEDIPTPEAMGQAIEACLADSNDRKGDEACIGLPSGKCRDVPGNQTTVGMATCIQNETTAWDAILNALWPKLEEQAKTADADDGPAAMGLPTQAETLLAAQRAWLAYRDAECGYEYARAGGGSIRQLYGASCLLQLTAERVVDFRDWLRPEG